MHIHILRNMKQNILCNFQPIPQQPDFVCSFPFPPIMNMPFPDPFSFINDKFWDINIPQTGMSASAAAPTADSRTNSGGSSQEQTATLGSAYNVRFFLWGLLSIVPPFCRHGDLRFMTIAVKSNS